MTAIQPISVGSERFDIAFSFVTRTDIRVAKELRDLLQPECSVFLYTDHPQVVGGAEGVTAYSRIFRYDSRLAVILLRHDWGETPRTAIEELALRERALQTDYRSFVIMGMEEKAELPTWVPSGTASVPGWIETRERTAEAIRIVARAARREYVL
jgi:hypothetical protein